MASFNLTRWWSMDTDSHWDSKRWRGAYMCVFGP